MSILAKGSQLLSSDSASPVAFVAITGVEEINPPNPTMASLATTNHNTTDASTTSEPGLLTGGDVTALFVVDPADAKQTLLQTDFAARTKRNYKTSVPTSPVDEQAFNAWVKNIESLAPVDDIYRKRVTLEITGPVT